MGLKPNKRILVVEDYAGWQTVIHDLLQQVADALGCTIEVVFATRFAEALDKIAATSYDSVTIDNKLLDGRMAKTLLDHIAGLDHRVPVVVISGVVDPHDVRDFFKEYGVHDFFWKDDFKPSQFKQTLARLLTPVEEGEEQEVSQTKKSGDKHMDWNTIVSTAVSAMAAEAAFEGIKGLWNWVRETVFKSRDESARQVLESFEEDPESNKDALIDVIRRLSPDDDAVLRGQVQGLIQEVQLLKGAHLFSLLDNPSYYTFNDLKRICSRVNPRWEDETGSNPKREVLARWVVEYAPTRNRLQDLIAAMIEVNPTVMLQ
jgi:CheY-like chemotaxis protein